MREVRRYLFSLHTHKGTRVLLDGGSLEPKVEGLDGYRGSRLQVCVREGVKQYRPV